MNHSASTASQVSAAAAHMLPANTRICAVLIDIYGSQPIQPTNASHAITSMKQTMSRPVMAHSFSDFADRYNARNDLPMVHLTGEALRNTQPLRSLWPSLSGNSDGQRDSRKYNLTASRTRYVSGQVQQPGERHGQRKDAKLFAACPHDARAAAVVCNRRSRIETRPFDPQSPALLVGHLARRAADVEETQANALAATGEDVGGRVTVRGVPQHRRQPGFQFLLSEYGETSWKQLTSSNPPIKRKSNARSCRAMHVCAAATSESTARSNGRRKLQSNLRSLSAVRCGLRPMKSLASARHPTSQCLSSSIEFSRDRIPRLMYRANHGTQHQTDERLDVKGHLARVLL